MHHSSVVWYAGREGLHFLLFYGQYERVWMTVVLGKGRGLLAKRGQYRKIKGGKTVNAEEYVCIPKSDELGARITLVRNAIYGLATRYESTSIPDTINLTAGDA